MACTHWTVTHSSLAVGNGQWKRFQILHDNPQLLGYVMAMLRHQLDFIWNELQSRNRGTLVVQNLRPLIWILRLEGTPLIWVTPFTGSLYESDGRRKHFFSLYLFDFTLSVIHSFTDTGAYFFWIPASKEDRLRHTASRDWASIGFLDFRFRASHHWTEFWKQFQ